jgi:hypothetical protein
MRIQFTGFFFLTVALCVCSGAASGQEQPPEFSINVDSSIVPFPFRVIDAEYSSSLNAIVAIAESPNQLHLYYPDSNSFAAVNLQLAPRCVSVSPDGLEAVVGHNAFISHVDLEALALLDTIPLSANASDIVHGGNGFAYVFGGSDYVHSIELETGEESQRFNFYDVSVRRHPAGNRLYGAMRNVSPSDILRYSIGTDGTIVSSNDSVYHGDYSICGDVWISADGLRLFTACGNVFRASDDPSTDMRFNGKLSQESNVRWATHSLPGNSIAVLPGYSQFTYPPQPRADSQVRYYTHDFLLYRGYAVLPSFVVGDASWAARGRWIFFNAAGTKQYVVVQADEASGILNDYGLVTIDCTNASVTFNPPSTSIGADAATVQTPLIGSAGCGWKATSNVSWLSTFSSGVGDGTLTFTATANTTAAARTGTITAGNATFTVTQAAPVPAAVTATATSPSSIEVSWTMNGAFDHYEVWRSSGSGYAFLGAPSSMSYTDSTAAPGTAYLYSVRAVATGVGTTDFGTPDYAHTFSFTDPLLAPGTLLKAAHIAELRSVVNALRAAGGVEEAAFADPVLTGAIARTMHVTELRTALNALRATLGMPALVFSALPAGTVIATTQTTELRTATQ